MFVRQRSRRVIGDLHALSLLIACPCPGLSVGIPHLVVAFKEPHRRPDLIVLTT